MRGPAVLEVARTGLSSGGVIAQLEIVEGAVEVAAREADSPYERALLIEVSDEFL